MQFTVGGAFYAFSEDPDECNLAPDCYYCTEARALYEQHTASAPVIEEVSTDADGTTYFHFGGEYYAFRDNCFNGPDCERCATSRAIWNANTPTPSATGCGCEYPDECTETDNCNSPLDDAYPAFEADLIELVDSQVQRELDICDSLNTRLQQERDAATDKYVTLRNESIQMAQLGIQQAMLLDEAQARIVELTQMLNEAHSFNEQLLEQHDQFGEERAVKIHTIETLSAQLVEMRSYAHSRDEFFDNLLLAAVKGNR